MSIIEVMKHIELIEVIGIALADLRFGLWLVALVLVLLLLVSPDY